jgi:prenyltransferase beta subunit
MKKLLLFLGIFICFLNSQNIILAESNPTVDKGLKYLRSQQKQDGNIDGFPGVSDWAIMAFATAGVDTTTVASTSGQTLFAWLQSNLPTSTATSNEWARKILAVTAIGQNPYDFSGVNLVSGLKNNNNYNNNQIGSLTADNDDMFGLLALLASKENSTSKIITDTTSFIIAHQHADGGFSYETDPSTGSDIDDTAAAIMALNAAKSQGVTVDKLQTVIDSAKAYLLSHQNADGGFAYDSNPASWDTTSNVSSTSWVLMSLSSLGMTNENEYMKAKNYITSTQQSDGSFPWQPAFPPGDTFDTSYAIIAINEAFWPIHIFSGTVPGETEIATPTATVTSTVTETITPTATPTPEDIIPTELLSQDATTNPTPTPTTTPKQETIGSNFVSSELLSQNTPTITPIITSLIVPSPTTEVLGTQTNAERHLPIQKTELPKAASFFLGAGILFTLLHIAKLTLLPRVLKLFH